MILRPSTSTIALAAAMTLGVIAASAAPASAKPGLIQVQYDRYQDQRGAYGRDPYYQPPPPPRGDPYSRAPYAGGEYPQWRAGDVVPPEVLNYVVPDWERRGLERPPGGHHWVRVATQFLLVRERDRRIARILSFD